MIEYVIESQGEEKVAVGIRGDDKTEIINHYWGFWNWKATSGEDLIWTNEQVKVIPTWLANIRPSGFVHRCVAAERLAINRRLFVGDLTRDPIRKSQTTFRAGAGVAAGEGVMPNALELGVFECEFK